MNWKGLFLYLILVICVLTILVLVMLPAWKTQYAQNARLAEEYRTAMAALEKGDYIQAYEGFMQIKYKDSQQQARSIRKLYLAEMLDGISLGEKIYFGKYNGFPLTWTVVAVRDGYAVLACDTAVAKKQYNEDFGSERPDSRGWHYNEWPACSLRTWLNEEFIGAFSEDELSVMKKATVPNAGLFKVEAVTADFVYILSSREMEAAVEAGWDKEGKLRAGSFWLRGSAAGNGNDAQGYNIEIVAGYSNIVNSHDIIPVIWVQAAPVDVPENSVFDVEK